jgi:hypothetical protein
MKRYGYENHIVTRDGNDEHRGYRIFDRVRGLKNTLAITYDPADAERIINALNIQDARLQELLSLTGAK